MDFTEQLSDLLGGQQAPRASDGIGFRILYECQVCQRVWLRDGKTDLLEMSPEQIQQIALELSADLSCLPRVTCRPCLWRAGGGSVEIDQYGGGEGFGWYWEIPHPIVLHASSAILSERCVRDKETLPELLTHPQKMRSVLQVVKDLPFPRRFNALPDAYGQLQAQVFRPGFGQTGTQNWRWRAWIFYLDCPPLGGQATITFMLALPHTVRLLEPTVFTIWQFLMDLTLVGGMPEQPKAPFGEVPL
jgi:hypothetical protein